jgi:hypothetical protein
MILIQGQVQYAITGGMHDCTAAGEFPEPACFSVSITGIGMDSTLQPAAARGSAL